MRPTLRRGDGFQDTTPHLRPDVERLQQALRRAGHETDLDGLFGPGTESAVRAFQTDHGLKVDGVVGPKTWALLDPRDATRDASRYAGISGFETFPGDLDWIHEWEGHVGKPYWPGGQSGVTLDPGFDLGYQPRERMRELYGDTLSAEQSRALTRVLARKGLDAKEALKGDEVLASIRVSRAHANQVMPLVAVRYWEPAVRRFPPAATAATPPSVQTVLLSLAYNRGPNNAGLEVLSEPIAASRWLEMADRVGAMQQDHALPGIRRRRRAEADLIRQELDFG